MKLQAIVPCGAALCNVQAADCILPALTARPTPSLLVPISFNALIICSLCVELNAFSKSTAAHCLFKFRFLS